MLGQNVCADWMCRLNVQIECADWVCRLNVQIECADWMCRLNVQIECAANRLLHLNVDWMCSEIRRLSVPRNSHCVFYVRFCWSARHWICTSNLHIKSASSVISCVFHCTSNLKVIAADSLLLHIKSALKKRKSNWVWKASNVRLCDIAQNNYL
jgi:hypothetical protein